MGSWCESVEMHQCLTLMRAASETQTQRMLHRFKDLLYHLLNYLLKLIPTSFNQLINH